MPGQAALGRSMNELGMNLQSPLPSAQEGGNKKEGGKQAARAEGKGSRPRRQGRPAL